MDYKIEKTFVGESIVRYACEYCKQLLESPLRDAGKTEPCPACNNRHTVPGKNELAILCLEDERNAKQKTEKELIAQKIEMAYQVRMSRALAEKEQRQHLTNPLGLVRCETCQAEISARARTCPKCGGPTFFAKKSMAKLKAILITLAIVTLIFVVVCAVVKSSFDEKIQKEKNFQAWLKSMTPQNENR